MKKGPLSLLPEDYEGFKDSKERNSLPCFRLEILVSTL